MSIPRISIIGLSEEGQKLASEFNSIISYIENGGIDSECLAPGSVIKETIRQYAVGNTQIGQDEVDAINVNSAVIKELFAQLIDTEKVTIKGAGGLLKIINNLITMQDGNLTFRVKMGDVNSNGSLYNLEIYNESGVKLFDAVNGLTAEGIPVGTVDTEKLKDGTFTRTWKLAVDPDDANKQLWFGWLGDGYGIGYTEDAGETFVSRNDGTNGYQDLTVTGTLNIMGTVRTGPNANIDIYQGAVTLTVDPSLTDPNNETTFTTFGAAIGILGKRLRGDTVINVAVGTYNEDFAVSGFYGNGTLTINLAATSATSKVIFIGNHYITNNSAAIIINGLYTADADNTKQPMFTGTAGSTSAYSMRIYNNPGSVQLIRLCFRANGASATNNLRIEYCHGVTMQYCCAENAQTGFYSILLSTSFLCAENCRGTNAGIGCTYRGGATYRRYGTCVNGTQGAASQTASGLLQDVGTITPTNSVAQSNPGSNAVLQCYPVESRTYWNESTTIETVQNIENNYSWNAIYSDYWASGADLRQGRIVLQTNGEFVSTVYSGAAYGTLRFGSGAGTPTSLSGKARVSARLRLSRYPNTGASGAVPVSLYRCELTDIPAGGASSPNGSVSGGAVPLGSLAWGETKWFDIPLWMAAYLINGESWAIYSGNSNYAKFYGIEGDAAHKPLLEITYVP